MQIDARGLGCPKPVILAEEALSKTPEGIVEVLVDNEASVKNLSRFARNNGLYSETAKVENYWTVKIVKGYPCEGGTAPFSQEFETASTGKKGLMLVIGTDAIGKDEELGKILMKGFLETMRATGELPDTLFFLNAGVKLTTANEDAITVLKEIEKKGVEIFSCGTCLDYYGLAGSLRVGFRGATGQLVEGLKDFAKVVWI